MTDKGVKKLGSDIVKEASPEKLHKAAKEYLILQLYMTSEFIYDNYGIETLKKYYLFNQESYVRLKMNTFYKMLEGVIKRLPKGLKMKEGLKMMIDELQFLESPKNVVILEKTSDHAIFEVIKCSVRKIFNRFAKKSAKTDLIDKCCLWCMESIPFAEKYGFKYRIELTKKGCLNYLE
jgi:hypothetical protein